MRRTETRLAALSAMCMWTTACAVHAVAPQQGSAYYTDLHGAAALVRAMDAVGRIDKSYIRYRNAGMDWMLSHMYDFPGEGRTWIQNPSAPKGHPSYHMTMLVIGNFNAETVLEVCRKEKNPVYMKALCDHVDWLKHIALKQESEDGVMYAWTMRHYLEPEKKKKRKVFVTSGHGHGIGYILSLLAGYYTLVNDQSVLPYLEGGIRYAYAASIKGGRGKDEMIHWRHFKVGEVAGWCRGTSGTLYGMLKAQKVLPGVMVGKNRSIEDVIQSGLRYLLSEATEDRDGLIWANMNGRAGEKNIGVGRGIAGIGMTLWMGYTMNRTAGDDRMAEACREAAGRTIRNILAYLEPLNPSEPMTQYAMRGDQKAHDTSNRLRETIGYCSGAGGAYLWLLQYADAVRREDPETARRCEDAVKILANRLINTAFVVQGTYAWKNQLEKFGTNTVNMAFDHGHTGVVCTLADIGLRFKDERILAAAKKAADFVLLHIAKDGHGMKMPHLVPLDSGAVPMVRYRR